MNDIQVFNSEQFGEVRTAGTAQEPIFCAADIAVHWVMLMGERPLLTIAKRVM